MKTTVREGGSGGRGPPERLRREQVRASGVIDSSGSNRGDEKWSGSVGIVQLKATGYPDGCNTGCKK